MLRFLGFVVVIVALAAALGLWRGWFSVSAASSGEGTSGITLTMDGNKLQEDADAVSQQIRALSRRVALQVEPLRAGGDSLDATVASRPSGGVLRVTVNSTTLELPVPPEVPVAHGDRPITLGQLRAGDVVRLRFIERGEELVLVGVQRR